MDEKERASALERLAPKPTAQEMEAVNGLFRHFLFKRCGKSEIWTTCCRRHTFVKPDTDNADELRVLHAPHTPEPRNGWDHSPTVKRRCRCPYCGAEVTVKELRYSGGRANLWSFRRAVILRQWRGALWATAWDCDKNYSRAGMNGEPVLTELPEMKLLGVYRFAPGMAEQATRPWWCSGGTPMSYHRQTAPGKSNGRKGGLWKVHSPYTYCAELGSGYDVIGLLEADKGFMRWCGIGKIHLPSDDFVELLTACCFYPRQIEMLVKLGLEDAVKDLVVRGVRNADIIKWDADKPRDFMKCTPKEAMAACFSREPLRALRLYIRHRDTPLKMTIETAAWLADATIGRGEENYAVRLLKRLSITAEKLTAYLEKNRVALQEGGRPGSGTRRGVLQLYKDYLDAAENCGMDMENPLILMPRSSSLSFSAASAFRPHLACCRPSAISATDPAPARTASGRSPGSGCRRSPPARSGSRVPVRLCCRSFQWSPAACGACHAGAGTEWLSLPSCAGQCNRLRSASAPCPRPRSHRR